jgi:tRNA(fMet)-specific endonuclease VapC
VILLDTNICIAVMNGRPAALLDRLDRVVARHGRASISTISVFELRFGAAKSAHVLANSKTLDVFLPSLNILSFEEEDARIAGNIRAELQRVGRPIGPYDYLIAAQALRHELTLITANEREFLRVEGLIIENWLA